MLYKKHTSNRTLYNDNQTINKLTLYTQKLTLTKQNPIKPSKTQLDSLSFSLSSASRNTPANLKSSYTTNINALNYQKSSIEKLQLTKRKNEHLQDKIATVLNQIKKTNPYYSYSSLMSSKHLCIEKIKNKSKRRPKSKELKFLEMKIMLNHPIQIDSETIKSSLNKATYLLSDSSKLMNTISNHKRVQSENEQREINNFSKEFNNGTSKGTRRNSIGQKSMKKTQSRNNNNEGLIKRTFSGYNDMLSTITRPIIMSATQMKILASYQSIH